MLDGRLSTWQRAQRRYKWYEGNKQEVVNYNPKRDRGLAIVQSKGPAKSRVA